jgi:Tryptophan RNA-binding attenuator protein inhibitory protein
MSEPLMIKCLYRSDGVHCHRGHLYESVSGHPAGLEGFALDCPACGGRGLLLTSAGRELLRFLQAFPVNAE